MAGAFASVALNRFLGVQPIDLAFRIVVGVGFCVVESFRACQVQFSSHEQSMSAANPVAGFGKSGQSTPGRPLTGCRPLV